MADPEVKLLDLDGDGITDVLRNGTGEWQELDLSAEYWTGDAPLLKRPAGLTDLLRGLARRQRRDAVRSLSGTTLRTELYALDGSSRHDRPYTVTESLPGVAQVRGLAPVTPGGLVDSWLVFDGEPQLPQDRVEEEFEHKLEVVRLRWTV